MGLTIDKTTVKKNDPKNKLSEREKKRAEYFEEEQNRKEILAAGDDDVKKGIKAVAEQVQADEKMKQKVEEEELNKLDMKRKFHNSYAAQLAQSLAKLLEILDWITGWRAEVTITDGSPITVQKRSFSTQHGILLLVLTPDGRLFHQGMRISGDPLLDMAAMHRLALYAENTLDTEKGLMFSDREEDTSSIVDKNGIKLTGTKPEGPTHTNGGTAI